MLFVKVSSCLLSSSFPWCREPFCFHLFTYSWPQEVSDLILTQSVFSPTVLLYLVQSAFPAEDIRAMDSTYCSIGKGLPDLQLYWGLGHYLAKAESFVRTCLSWGRLCTLPWVLLPSVWTLTPKLVQCELLLRAHRSSVPGLLGRLKGTVSACLVAGPGD